jgi:hypothetical protein
MAKVPRIRLSPFITRVAHALSILPAPAPDTASVPGAAPVPRAPSEAPRLVPGSVAWYFRDKRARQAFALTLRAMQERHRAQVRSDLRSKSYSNLTRYVIYMAFLESTSYPVRPLDLPPASETGCRPGRTLRRAGTPPTPAGNAATATLPPPT